MVANSNAMHYVLNNKKCKQWILVVCQHTSNDAKPLGHFRIRLQYTSIVGVSLPTSRPKRQHSAPRFFNFDSIWSRALCSFWDSAWHQIRVIFRHSGWWRRKKPGYTWTYEKNMFCFLVFFNFLHGQLSTCRGASCFHSAKFQRSVLVFMKN